MVKAPAFHQCGRVRFPDSASYGGLLLVLVPAPMGFLRVLRFSSLHKNQQFQIPIRYGNTGRAATLWMCQWNSHLFYCTRKIRLARMVKISFLFLSTRRQDIHIETCFLIHAAPRWLAIRLDTLSVTLTAAVAFIAIAAQSGPGEWDILLLIISTPSKTIQYWSISYPESSDSLASSWSSGETGDQSLSWQPTAGQGAWGLWVRD